MYGYQEQASGGTESLLFLIGEIYDAAGDSIRWPAVLDRAAEAVNCERVAVSARTPNARPSDFCGQAQIAPRDLILYMEQDAHPNVLPEQLRPLSSADPACPRQLDLNEAIVFKTLIAHLRRASRMHEQHEHARLHANDLKSVLDSLDRGVFGLDRKGLVVLANRQAELIAKKGDGLKLIRGCLTATSCSENRELQLRILKGVGTEMKGDGSRSASLSLSRCSDDLPLQLVLTPFQSDLPANHGRLAALVFVSDPAQKPLSRSVLLRQIYRLSPAECRVADMMLQGLTLREAASRMRITLGTARCQLKQVLAKTGTCRQTELMRMMLSLPAAA